MRVQIKRLIESVSPLRELADNQPLVSSGLLTSLQIVELASLIEKEFAVDFAAIGFDVYYFETVISIEEMVLVHGTSGKTPTSFRA